MSVFIISAPAETTKEEVVNSLRSKIAGQAEIRPFRLPDFKIGTLDSLVVLSDDLSKYDQSFEGITNKIADNLKSLVHGDVEQWKNNLIVDDKSVDNYLQGFQWNDMKYRTDKSLREICDIIVQDVNSIDSLMKSRMTKYNLIKSQLTSLQRKQNGNLSVKSLVDIVKKEHFVYSEYLTTLIVAVPKNLVKEWYASYETLCQMVVPRSSELIAQDEEFSLFNVTLFKKVVEDFKNACRERKFLVRDFTFDENKISQEQKDLAAISAEEKDQWQTSLRLCKANFGESFSCWMHIKALRVYVESILRYGLPPNFQPMIIKPKNKNERRVRDILAQHYAKLGDKNEGDGKSKKKEQLDENIQLLLGDKDYYPYVSFDVNWKI